MSGKSRGPVVRSLTSHGAVGEFLELYGPNETEPWCTEVTSYSTMNTTYYYCILSTMSLLTHRQPLGISLTYASFTLRSPGGHRWSRFTFGLVVRMLRSASLLCLKFPNRTVYRVGELSDGILRFMVWGQFL